MIEVIIFIFELVIMPSVSGVVELTCFCVHVIVDTHAIVFVVTLQLAGLNINNNFSSDSVVHETLVNEEERWWERQYTTVIWNKNETI